MILKFSYKVLLGQTAVPMFQEQLAAARIYTKDLILQILRICVLVTTASHHRGAKRWAAAILPTPTVASSY
jgi:hypothetical protein